MGIRMAIAVCQGNGMPKTSIVVCQGRSASKTSRSMSVSTTPHHPISTQQTISVMPAEDFLDGFTVMSLVVGSKPVPALCEVRSQGDFAGGGLRRGQSRDSGLISAWDWRE